MKRLIIIGAGGFGREVLCYALDIPKEERDWEVFGFLSDYADDLDKYDIKYSIIGTIKDYIPTQDDVFICAIGESDARLKICRDFKSRGAEFISLIHPTAYIGQRAVWGEGLIMAPRAGIGPDVRLGSFVIVNCHSGFGHDAIAEDGCTLSAFCDVTGYCRLEEGVFMGSHSTIIPHVTVGRYAKIGAGAVVLKNVPADAVMFGNPAKHVF